MKFHKLACSQENGEVRSMIDVFIHKLIGEDLSELKIPEMHVSASYNLVTQPFFATVPRKYHCPSSSMDFPVFLSSVAFI